MARVTRQKAGFTILESLIALVIIVTALVGIVNLYAVSYNFTSDATNTSVSYNLARDAIEKVHSQGFVNAAEGTSITYYDRTGANPSSTQGTNRYKVTTVVTSDKFAGVNVADDALRAVKVTVRDLALAKDIYITGTNLVRGGI